VIKNSENNEEFPAKKSQTKSKSDENAKNNEETLYFGLNEVWANKWKGGLRIHEAIYSSGKNSWELCFYI
jgi:hypothetical protein